MAARLLELRRVLKPTGTLYLHCDPTVSHHLKLVTDAVMGRKAFRNEIVWCYRGGGVPKKDFARKHDIIFRYAIREPTFNVDAVRVPYSGVCHGFSPEPLRQVLSDQQGLLRVQAAREGETPRGLVDDPALDAIRQEGTNGLPHSEAARASRPDHRGEFRTRGDVVLDPFCGCATACIAAQGRHRKWVGIDISPEGG